MSDELKSEDLLKLSEYFQKSRDELQRKVDSILSIDLVQIQTCEQSATSGHERSKNILDSKESVDLAGTPITIQIATKLRNLTVNSCVHHFSDEFKRARFLFRELESDMPYGLLASKNGSKGLIMAVQAHLFKNLIINSYTSINGEEITDTKLRNERKIFRPSLLERRDALVKTLSDILWQAGERQRACVVLNTFSNMFSLAPSSKQTTYCFDGYTEKLKLHEFNEFKKLQEFIRKNLNLFQIELGLIMFLYSLILSRGFNKIFEDLQGECLIGDMEDCRLGLYNLILTGQALPYLHNNLNYYDRNGDALEVPEQGHKKRSEVGLLYWNRNEDDDMRTEVGSMLRTPKYPIWLVLLNNNQVAILFSTKIDLLNDWRLERLFTLHFYSCLRKQEEALQLTVDTRDDLDISAKAHEEDVKMKQKRKMLQKTFKQFLFDLDKDDDLVEAIHTKWPNCEIESVDMKDLMMCL